MTPLQERTLERMKSGFMAMQRPGHEWQVILTRGHEKHYIGYSLIRTLVKMGHVKPLKVDVAAGEYRMWAYNSPDVCEKCGDDFPECGCAEEAESEVA